MQPMLNLSAPAGRFARVETAFDGLRALSRQLVLYAGRGIDSVAGMMFSTWAPAPTITNSIYIQAVSQRLGVKPLAS
jgi:hypothetical protein